MILRQALIVFLLAIMLIRYAMRLKTDIWVKALLRRVQSAGAMVLVGHRGDIDAGAVFIRVNRLDGTSDLLGSMTNMEGARIWCYILPMQSADVVVEERINKECQYDPDIWVVEIEDKHGRHFIEETVTTV